jgi:hypothetical protein
MKKKTDLLEHLAALLQYGKDNNQPAVLLMGAGISVSAGIPSAGGLTKEALEQFPRFFSKSEKDEPESLQYNQVMSKLSNVQRKKLFKPFIDDAKLNFAHIVIAELFKQGYFSRILTVNFDPLLIHACYTVGMYPLPAIYDLGAVKSLNAELLNDPSIVYLNGQHVGFVQRNTPEQLKAHEEILTQIVRSTGCSKTWLIAGYSGENDPLMTALENLRPYNNWLYWLQRGDSLRKNKDGYIIESHQFLIKDEECKVIYNCDSDEFFLDLRKKLSCNLDFIDSPESELKNYLERINFKTGGATGAGLKIKAKEYISLLKQYDPIKETDVLYEEFSSFDNTSIETLKISLLDFTKKHKNNKTFSACYLKSACYFRLATISEIEHMKNYITLATTEIDHIYKIDLNDTDVLFFKGVLTRVSSIFESKHDEKITKLSESISIAKKIIKIDNNYQGYGELGVSLLYMFTAAGDKTYLEQAFLNLKKSEELSNNSYRLGFARYFLLTGNKQMMYSYLDKYLKDCDVEERISAKNAINLTTAFRDLFSDNEFRNWYEDQFDEIPPQRTNSSTNEDA